MNSKERFQRTMRRELPDRLPVDMIWPRSETMRALKDHFGVDSMDAVRDRLGVDFVWSEVGVEYTAYRNRCNGTLTGDAPGAGRPYIFHDPMTFENEWGVIHRVGADGKYLQWVSGPLVGKESLDGWRLPEMRLDSIETTRRRFARYPDRIVVAELANPFKTAWQLCGFSHFMTLMALNPGFVDELFEHLFVHETEKAVIAARAGADIVALVGDVAGAHGPMFSPAMWNAFLKPGFARLIRAAKAANPSVRAFFHSDGELAAMIPAFIDTGIEILNPIESNCMDPAVLKREFGDRIAFHGAISVQRTIPRGTVADVKQEVYTRIRTVGYDGGYIVSNENSFPFNAPLANILAMYEAVRDFDYDSLR